jgi:hypothetical protein
MPTSRIVLALALSLLTVAPLARAHAQAGMRSGFSAGVAAGSVRATGLDDARVHGVVALRYALPGSPLVLRADGGAGPQALDPNVATVALGLRVLDAGGASLYLLGGGGWYSGAHVTHRGRNAGMGIEARPAGLRGRGLFVEGRAHSYFYSDLEGRHTARLTTIVAGLWW